MPPTGSASWSERQAARRGVPEGHLLGRVAETAAIDDALRGRRPIVVTGEAGIGKSTLLLDAVGRSGRRAHVGGGLGMLSALPLLALTRAVGALPDGEPGRIARLVASRVGDRILVLDDLQWADEATIDVIARLSQVTTMLTAVRTGEDRAAEVTKRLSAAGFEVLPIGVIETDHGIEIARRLRPDLGQAAAQALVVRAGGNPLLIEELARSGATRSLALAIAHRLRDLDQPARDLLGLLAVLGRPVHLMHPTPAADDLIARDLAIESDGHIEIRHPLIAEVVRDGLDAARSAALHHRAASLADDPLEIAQHLALGGEAAAAYELAARGAEHATGGRRVALLALAAELANGPEATERRLDAAGLLADAGSFGAASRLLALVTTTDLALGPRGEGIAAAIRWGTGDAQGAVAAARAAVDAAPSGTPLAARLHVQFAWMLTMLRRGSDAVAMAESALEAVHALGLPEAAAKRTLATARSITGEPMGAVAGLLEEAIAESRSRDDVAEELLCGKLLVATHEGSGDPAAGRRIGERLVARARETGMVAWEQSIRASMLALANGQLELDRVVSEGESLLLETLEPRTRAQVTGYVALALVDLGRFDEAARYIDVGLTVAPEDVDGRLDLEWARAELAFATGDARAADRHASACLERFGGLDYGDLRFVQLVRDWSRWTLGRSSGPPVSPGPMHPVWAGTVDESRGIALLVDGAYRAAAEAFRDAAAGYRQHHRRGDLRSRWAAGEALRRSGMVGQARAALEEIETEAAALGLSPLLGRIRRSLRLAGSPRTTRRPSSGRLTAREREVLDLVAGGLTNTQVAARLGIGRPTVARLLANGYAKLGTASRHQAALEAQELV